MQTPPARAATAPAASSPASEDRYARYRISLDAGTGASQTLAHWLPLATVWATDDTLPGADRRTRPGTRGADAPAAAPRRRAPARPRRATRP
ncbi:hypothetical protein [Streptomyces sp. G-G2]|uniref:hypothetical protein n=1 Tax=Streptomyces sp. G-G2 TaxID=3046201 RepID=UPI0024BA94C3|nr:hypothetical protein [Streptomyces sp. G-G2]MDJ0384272.1 hypothetical protein [Streptomyces sp. G-G2]